MKHGLWLLSMLMAGRVTAVQLDPVAPPLSGLVPASIPGLTSGPTPIVRDVQAATRLGKALFWDMNVGDQGRACASCHYQAGTEPRKSRPAGSAGVSRNVPSVIGAAFNVRNFWDGRANAGFNGSSPWGPDDPAAGVYRVVEGRIRFVRLTLEHAALASQAMEPPLNRHEMASGSTTFAAIAGKLLPERPLKRQQVHPDDSLLGPVRHESGWGLRQVYADWIRQAFDPAYWEDPAATTGNRLMESNFSLFFGVALQLYESTLIPDQTRFDAPRTPEGYPTGYTEAEKRGLDLFNQAECDFCHRGPAFSAATESQPGVERRVLRVNRDTRTTFTPLFDSGFANIGVAPNRRDIGLGGRDAFGNPLSRAARYRNVLAHPEQPDADRWAGETAGLTLGFRIGFSPDELRTAGVRVPKPGVVQQELAKPGQGRLPLAINGSFKIPGLRNVALTAPYMHDGSLATLEAVIDFYDRGGRFKNPEHFATFVFPQHFTRSQKADLRAFLLTLTDERVRLEQAPFDHPALTLPSGLNMPASGRQGRIVSQTVSYHTLPRDMTRF
ncbi:hypothetical protein FJZ55_02215 [Candidatus Woesearchaeota archaeon]|nr:hypothetical protein [Candidatus Woesearchaeota archaeon]